MPTTSPQRTCDRQATDTAQRAAEEAEEAEEEANRGRRREEDGLAAQRSDPPVFDPRSLSPSPSHSTGPNFLADHAVGVVEVMLVFMCFRCTYHLDAGEMGKSSCPAVPILYAYANSVQTSAITSTEGFCTEFECSWRFYICRMLSQLAVGLQDVCWFGYMVTER